MKLDYFGIGYEPSAVESEVSSAGEQRSLTAFQGGTGGDHESLGGSSRLVMSSNALTLSGQDGVLSAVSGDGRFGSRTVMGKSSEERGVAGKRKFLASGHDYGFDDEDDDLVMFTGTSGSNVEYDASIDFGAGRAKRQKKSSDSRVSAAVESAHHSSRNKLDRCSDGALPLPGFVLAEKGRVMQYENLKLDPIVVPVDFDGRHHFSGDEIVLNQSIAQFKDEVANRKMILQRKLKELSVEERNRAVGTRNSTSIKKSRDDEQDDELSVLAKMKLSAALSQRFVVGSVQRKSRFDEQKKMSDELAEVVRFRPFAADPLKQARFEEFVRKKTERTSPVVSTFRTVQTAEEKDFERVFHAMTSGSCQLHCLKGLLLVQFNENLDLMSRRK
eukprot:TRINITY_DN17575_c1_g1_i1.p1 TRINITY_DN17575_c1_g1~~TRINITY_DN17575_c1_g1_i1.p1  ORF type:complete len:387 (+),score=119.40 TRINITY_DN17575_c1_g1_i1:568-1728(+)